MGCKQKLDVETNNFVGLLLQRKAKCHMLQGSTFRGPERSSGLQPGKGATNQQKWLLTYDAGTFEVVLIYLK